MGSKNGVEENLLIQQGYCVSSFWYASSVE